jgi:hypothetical protein
LREGFVPRAAQGKNLQSQGHHFFHSRVGQACFERRPTNRKRDEIMVGRRGKAPLVPPDILSNFKKALG